VTISRTAHELQEILERRPDVCPVCLLVARAIRRHIDAIFYEMVNDPPLREAIRKAGGFCKPHARLVLEQADALGTSVIFRDVLRTELHAIDEGQYDRPPNTVSSVARILDGSLPGRTQCPICREERGREEITVDSLLEAVRQPGFASVYERSGGICLPHFRLAFLRCRDTLAWRVILDVQRTAITGLVGELEELSRKFDYRYTDEAVGEESDSWKRALNVTSGWPEGYTGTGS
jgi:hypothetical protein